jgi:hypothetical protein
MLCGRCCFDTNRHRIWWFFESTGRIHSGAEAVAFGMQYAALREGPGNQGAFKLSFRRARTRLIQKRKGGELRYFELLLAKPD